MVGGAALQPCRLGLADEAGEIERDQRRRTGSGAIEGQRERRPAVGALEDMVAAETGQPAVD